MTNPETPIPPATAGAEAKPSHHPTRIVLALAAFVVLSWGAWFVWLVEVELETEGNVMDYSRSIPADILLRGGPIQQLVEAVERSTNTQIELFGVPSDFDVPVDSTPLSSDVYNTLFRQFPPVPSIVGLDRITEAIQSEACVPVTYYIEADHVVITTADNLPRFDASAWVRRQWHKLEKGWSGV